MIERLKQFFYDGPFFDAMAGRIWKTLCGLLAAVGVAAGQGQLDLGPFGYWAGPLGIALALAAHGKQVDVAAEINKLTPEKRAELGLAVKP